MFKFIALQNGVYYSIAEENGKWRFFANKSGTGYDTRKDVTPKGACDTALIAEILRRPAICSDMSGALCNLVNTLEKNFLALEV